MASRRWVTASVNEALSRGLRGEVHRWGASAALAERSPLGNDRGRGPVAQWIRAADFGPSRPMRCGTERGDGSVGHRVICSLRLSGEPQQLGSQLEVQEYAPRRECLAPCPAGCFTNRPLARSRPHVRASVEVSIGCWSMGSLPRRCAAGVARWPTATSAPCAAASRLSASRYSGPRPGSPARVPCSELFAAAEDTATPAICHTIGPVDHVSGRSRAPGLIENRGGTEIARRTKKHESEVDRCNGRAVARHRGWRSPRSWY